MIDFVSIGIDGRFAEMILANPRIDFNQPININQEGTILSGHGRAMKLKQMGETEVDVYVPDRMLTPKQEEEVLVHLQNCVKKKVYYHRYNKKDRNWYQECLLLMIKKLMMQQRNN